MIQQYLNILRRWIWLLALTSISSGIVAYWVTSEKPAVYEATARLIVGPGIASVSPDLNAFRAGSQLMLTYAELAMTRPVLESVIAELQLGLSSDVLKKMVSVKTNEATQIMSVQVTGNDASLVVIITNALANSIVRLSPTGDDTTYDQVKADVQTQIQEIKENIEQNKTALKQLETQLITISSTEERQLLFEQLNQVRSQQTDLQRILASLYESYKSSNTNQIKVIELAVHAEETVSTLLLSTAMGAAAGLILTLTFVLIFEYFNDIIRTVSDLAYGINIPILATLVKHKRLSGIGRDRLIVHGLPDSRAAESYRVLSSKLLLSRFRNKIANVQTIQQNQNSLKAQSTSIEESVLHSVVISSIQADDNVSEIAANLAVLLAQTGHRVILVDAYLHRPSINRLFGISEQHGLADILLLRSLTPKSMIRQLRDSSSSTTEHIEQNQDSIMQSVLHETAALVSVDWAPGLKILTSGAQPNNPFELLVSPHMVDLIKSLEKQADLVIIAASPLLSSADSLILASRADGVVIVARSGKTRRDTLKEAVNALNSLKANILGLILDHQGSDIPATSKQNIVPQSADRADRQARRVASA